VTHSRATLNEAILGACRPQLRRDPLAYRSARTHHTQVREEQGTVLDLEAASQLLLVDHRAVERWNAEPALARQSMLVALVSQLRATLEQSRRRRERELHERRSSARGHRGEQAVDRGCLCVPKDVEELCALDERPVLLQAHDGWRNPWCQGHPVQATVGIGIA
jgi:hypothetical protein